MITSSPQALEAAAGGKVPRRMLMIGYNTVDEAASKGILRYDDPGSIELHYNFGAMFDEVLYVVPFGRETKDMRLTSTVSYRELGFDRGGRGIKLARAGIAHLPSGVRFIDDAVREFAPDVVQICGPHIPAVLGLISRRVRALPTVCFIEAFWETIIDQQSNLPKALRKMLPAWYRAVYRLFDQYSGAPSVAPDFYVSRGMRREKIARWVQHVDLRHVERAKIEDAPAAVLNTQRPRTAVIGRLHPEKLAREALEIFAKAGAREKGGTLIFVGDGEERSAIEVRAAQLGLAGQVLITGLMSHGTALSIMKAADFSIAPMQGSALLEAQAAGLAIIAYDHETHRALIEDGETGVLVPHRDTDAAAAVLARWFDDPISAEALGEKARMKVQQHFSVECVREILFSPFLRAVAARLGS